MLSWYLKCSICVCVFVCFIQMGPNCFVYLFCNGFIIKEKKAEFKGEVKVKGLKQ